MAIDKVRYFGDEVEADSATDELNLEEALDLIDSENEGLSFIDGQIMKPSFLDYNVPTALVVPVFVKELLG